MIDSENKAPTVANPERWVSEHGDALYRYALLHLRDATVAEEVVQETLLAALGAYERFSGRSSERTWLVGILKHKLIDHLRRQFRERPADADDASAEANAERENFDATGKWRPGPADWLTDPSAVRERSELRSALTDCLGTLPPKLAEAFSLREISDLDSEEICKALGITETNLWVMLHRARLRLRSCLEDDWKNR